tara:strand:- start:71 stop:1069 length:999 start_codon:yes stop_codon:yes gene_type:complete
MPEITIYTNDGDCANGVAEINPFTEGDATNEWTLKFNNGTNFYSPSNVTMRVGHVNGLPDGTYSNAFKWVDRADNKSTGSISVSSGVPTLSFNTNPLGGVVGTNGVYILRGPELDGAITSIEFLENGRGERSASGWPSDHRFGLVIDGGNLYPSGGTTTIPNGSGTSYAMGYARFSSSTGTGSAVVLLNGGLGFPVPPIVRLLESDYNYFDGVGYYPATFKAIGNWAKYEFPFKRDESGNDIIAATTLSPYSDGQITGAAQYDHSTLVIRPETVATASLAQSGTDWVGTMNPINAYTTARLALRNSTQLDLQIRGDGRTLFQGQITILNKIA